MFKHFGWIVAKHRGSNTNKPTELGDLQSRLFNHLFKILVYLNVFQLNYMKFVSIQQHTTSYCAAPLYNLSQCVHHRQFIVDFFYSCTSTKKLGVVNLVIVIVCVTVIVAVTFKLLPWVTTERIKKVYLLQPLIIPFSCC